MCFSLMWLKDLLIWLVIVGAIVSIIQLLIPWIISKFPAISILGQVLNIVLWAIIAIVVIYVVFALISCLLGSGGGLSLPRLR